MSRILSIEGRTSQSQRKATASVTLDGAFGQAYRSRQWVCGDANGDGNVTATDALQALTAAVGARSCTPCACDVDSSGGTTASDALRILRTAVGQSITLTCPAC